MPWTKKRLNAARPQRGAKVAFAISPCDSDVARAMVVANHYSGRCPGVRYAYGLHEGELMVGCVVYATPASYTLCNGVCGPGYRSHVLELARLVITTKTPNAASFLIGRSLASMPNHVVVSYADCNDHVGHIGYVYQATNWIYTGQGTAEPLWVDDKTGQVVAYTRRHIDRKARELGYDWKEGASSGPGLSKRPQKGKHRYVFLTGNKRFRREARAALRYTPQPYPKGDTRRHTGNIMSVMDRTLPADPLPTTTPPSLPSRKPLF